MKWFHVYLDGVFYETVMGRGAWRVAKLFRDRAKSSVNVTDHDTGEEVMLAKADPVMVKRVEVPTLIEPDELKD